MDPRPRPEPLPQMTSIFYTSQHRNNILHLLHQMIQTRNFSEAASIFCALATSSKTTKEDLMSVGAEIISNHSGASFEQCVTFYESLVEWETKNRAASVAEFSMFYAIHRKFKEALRAIRQRQTSRFRQENQDPLLVGYEGILAFHVWLIEHRYDLKEANDWVVDTSSKQVSEVDALFGDNKDEDYYDTAQECLEASYETNPNSDAYLYYLIILYMAKNNISRAAAVMKDFLSKNQANPNALRMAGTFLKHFCPDDSSLELRCWRKLIQLDCTSLEAFTGLTQLYARGRITPMEMTSALVNRLDYFRDDVRLWKMLNATLKIISDQRNGHHAAVAAEVDDGGGEYDFLEWRKVTHWWLRTIFLDHIRSHKLRKRIVAATNRVLVLHRAVACMSLFGEAIYVKTVAQIFAEEGSQDEFKLYMEKYELGGQVAAMQVDDYPEEGHEADDDQSQGDITSGQEYSNNEAPGDEMDEG